MKAIHLTADGKPAEELMMVEVSEPSAPSASEALCASSMSRLRKEDADASHPIDEIR